MKELSRFEIPLHSLGNGTVHYEFEIGSPFFQALDQNLIEQGDFKVSVTVEKRSEIMILDVRHRGKIHAPCDRCAEPINLPIEDQGEIIIKFVDDIRMDDEVTYLVKGTEKLNLAPFIFEVISLSLPLVRRVDCENDQSAPCNERVLDILNMKEKQTSHSPVWDELKKLNLES